ncbi:MAG: hypothetical protein WBN04_15580 [Paracoccaceae bacterium]
MQLPRPVGREAASRKYDILSALMAFALAQDKHVQRRVLRMMSLITTRYNWQRDELSMGQAEIARLWSVDERTVKREIARLRANGWLLVKRQGARGRVSLYGMDLGRMMEDTRPVWPNLGDDFIARIEPPPSGAGGSNVVPLRAMPAPVQDGTLWTFTQERLHGDDLASYGAWFHALTEAGLEDGCMTLAAPSRFHARYVETHLKDRLLSALRITDPSLRDVRIIV